MNALSRLWKSGAADADERVARTLAPRGFDEADRYLQSSALVLFLDRITRRLETWWRASATRHTASTVADLWSHPTAQSPRGGGPGSREAWAERYRVIGGVLATAAVTHITLTMIQGPRPGWFWLLIPSMIIAFALLLLASSRTAR
jgi:hypothetical protein